MLADYYHRIYPIRDALFPKLNYICETQSLLIEEIMLEELVFYKERVYFSVAFPSFLRCIYNSVGAF